MKRLLLIILPLLLIVGCSKPLNDETLIEKGGLMYHPDTKKLYSGKVFKNYIGGKPHLEGSYKNGEKDGLWITWLDNGIKKSELNYEKGILGIQNYFSTKGDIVTFKNIKLFLNGSWSPVKEYKKNKWENLEEKDYILKFENEKLIVRNGRDTLDITYDNDLHKVIMEDDGNLLDLMVIKTFNGYNDIISHVYNSPTWVDTVQMIRKNYKDGKEDGLETWYNENGQKEYEEIYKSSNELFELSNENLKDKKIDLAIDDLERLVTKYPQDRLASQAQYKLASINLNWKNDLASGYASLRATVNNYGGSIQAIQAQKEIDEFPEYILNKVDSLRKRKMVKEAVEHLIYMTEHYTHHELAPKGQYMLGDLYMNEFRDFPIAIQEYRKVIENFAGSSQEAHALFMIGYIYANVVNDPKSAEIEYGEFLKRFPNHELAPTVKFDLDYLGKSKEEIDSEK